jgi:HEAT repeat protein
MHRDDEEVAGLVATALRGVPESSEAWEAIHALARRGGAAVFKVASELLRSKRSRERERGADILGQLDGSEVERSRAVDRMLPLLGEEQDVQVLHALILGLGHLRDGRVAPALVPLKQHASARVRGAVVLSLLKAPGVEALPVLLTFLDDPDVGVRGLAMSHVPLLPVEVDSPELREVLVRRMGDEDPDLRAEAVLALARRGDSRTLEPLRKALRRKRVRREFVEAAGLLGDVSLLPMLRALEGQREDDAAFHRELSRAIAALGGA